VHLMKFSAENPRLRKAAKKKKKKKLKLNAMRMEYFKKLKVAVRVF